MIQLHKVRYAHPTGAVLLLSSNTIVECVSIARVPVLSDVNQAYPPTPIPVSRPTYRIPPSPKPTASTAVPHRQPQRHPPPTRPIPTSAPQTPAPSPPSRSSSSSTSTPTSPLPSAPTAIRRYSLSLKMQSGRFRARGSGCRPGAARAGRRCRGGA